MAVIAAVVVAAAAFYFWTVCRGGCGPDDRLAFEPSVGDTEVSLEAEGAPSPDVATVTPPPAEVMTPEGTSPPPAETSSVEHGQLVVQSTPSGALVTVDGQRAGTTPVTVPSLALGTHEVQVARPGFIPVRERVELTPQALSRTLSVTLATGAGAGGATQGSLVVDSRPRGAAVFVDSRQVGVTPQTVSGLDVGTHVVRIELAGYRPIRADVTIRPGEQTRLAVSLEPGRSSGLGLRGRRE